MPKASSCFPTPKVRRRLFLVLALSSVSKELLVILGTTKGSSMGKFFNHYCPDRAVGFGHPYSDRRPKILALYTWLSRL